MSSAKRTTSSRIPRSDKSGILGFWELKLSRAHLSDDSDRMLVTWTRRLVGCVTWFCLLCCKPPAARYTFLARFLHKTFVSACKMTSERMKKYFETVWERLVEYLGMNSRYHQMKMNDQGRREITLSASPRYPRRLEGNKNILRRRGW